MNYTRYGRNYNSCLVFIFYNFLEKYSTENLKICYIIKNIYFLFYADNFLYLTIFLPRGDKELVKIELKINSKFNHFSTFKFLSFRIVVDKLIGRYKFLLDYLWCKYMHMVHLFLLWSSLSHKIKDFIKLPNLKPFYIYSLNKNFMDCKNFE